MKALLAGHGRAAALASAMAERGVEADVHPAPAASGRATAPLAAALVELERRLEAGPPDLAISVGTGDASLALAVSAAKLGVPLVAWVGAEPEGDELERAERRILATLAAFDGGELEDAGAAAERILSWANLELGP